MSTNKVITEDNSIRIFKALKDSTHHKSGEFLYLQHKTHDYCMWVDEPYFKVDLWAIENSPQEYEEVFNTFGLGDPIHFISMTGSVISDYFLAAKHANLLRTGNGFSTIEEAEWINEQIRKLFMENGEVLLPTNFEQIIDWIHNLDKNEAIKNIREKYLVG